jgi:hypothetical protein
MFTFWVTPPIVTETAGSVVPAGVPGFPPPPPPPLLLPPPPQPAMAATSTQATTTAPATQRRCLRALYSPNMENQQKASVTTSNIVHFPKISGRPRQSGTNDDAAVVVNVIIAVAVPFTGIVTEAPELQLVSDGRPAHTGLIVTGPLLLNPFCAVKVSVVVPACPGAKMVTVVGFAEIVKFGPGVTGTVSVRGVVCVRLPEVPITVTVPENGAAVALAVSVNVLVLIAGLGLKAAVKPLGNPKAESDTLPLNPFRGVMVIVLVAWLPCATFKLLGTADST